MARVILTELTLRLKSDAAPGVVSAEWQLKESPCYPPLPGLEAPPAGKLAAERVVAPKINTQFTLDDVELAALRLAAPDLTALRARVTVAEVATLVAQAAERHDGRFNRVVIKVRGKQAAELERLPWEALFAFERLTVVRREDSPASYVWRPASRPTLGFPLALWAIGLERTIEKEELLDPYSMFALEAGALAWSDGEAPDIVHIECAHMALPAIVQRLDGGRGMRRPRLVVLHETGATAARPAVAVELMKAVGPDAVLHLAGAGRGAAIHALYRKLLHDWPIDRCLEEMTRSHGVEPAAAILRAFERGETSVTVSSVINDALAPEVTASGNFRGGVIDKGVPISDLPDPLPPDDATPAPAVGPERLRQAWRQALEAPLDAVTRESHRLDFFTEEHNLHDAVRVAREAGAVADTLRQLGDAKPAQLEEASARVTQVWISDPGTEQPVAPEQPLVVKRPYRLNVQVVRKVREAAWAQAAFPEHAVKEILARLGSVDLTVVIHPLTDGVTLSRPIDTMRLRTLGDSDPLAVDLTVGTAGHFELRVCVYFEMALLQAVVVSGTAGAAGATEGAIRTVVDFATSADFMTLDRQAQPDVTIWTNQAADGTHWFGVFAREHEERVTLERGKARSLSPHDLGVVAGQLQDALEAIVMRPGESPPNQLGVKRKPDPVYRYQPRAPADDAQRNDRMAQLVTLAQAGWAAYNALFTGVKSGDSPAASPREGLLSIARCRPEHTNVAWAALYDYPLRDPAPAVCDVFATQLAAGADLLDRPHECRAQAACPLADDARKRKTVCPFGFWGLRHRIEQPPNHIAPPAAGAVQTPEDLQKAAEMKTQIARPAGGGARLGIAWWPHFNKQVDEHLAALDALGPADAESERDKILDLLIRGQKQVFYFFCHGDGKDGSFYLRVGPREQGDVIKIGDLNDEDLDWTKGGPAPLVILNGCDTQAFKGDTINKLIDQLKANGASGVVGTEMKVHTFLAEDVGKALIAALAAGQPLGRAFLDLRRQLLRTQLNPLGLAYAFYGSAQLHLCDGDGCTTCHP